MDGGAEYTGKTVEDAIAQAERQLGTERTQLAVEIISAGSRGVFGIGAEPARVRARILNPPAVATPEAAAGSEPDTIHLPDERVSVGDSRGYDREATPIVHDTQPAPLPTDHAATPDLRQPTASEEDADGVEGAPVHDPDLPDEAATVLQRLLDTMGFDAEVNVRSEENPVILAVTGENLGILIGRRGDNLSSLQFMVNLILSKNRRQWPRVVIDVENYRARREESLRSLAERIAYRVGRQGRPFTLEAMTASDRRVIHLSLRDREGVETYSIGEGAARRVVIAPLRSGSSDVRSGDRGYSDRPSYGGRR